MSVNPALAIEAVRAAARQFSDDLENPAIPYEHTVRRIYSIIEAAAEAMVARDGRLSQQQKRHLTMAKVCIEQGDPDACRCHIYAAIKQT